ncbi:MAG TPA: capsule assembly Wzi family protein [Longimicrobium sp.]|nr:capsule assembly Wzi family protein [Longimicrobium sp.]
MKDHRISPPLPFRAVPAVPRRTRALVLALAAVPLGAAAQAQSPRAPGGPAAAEPVRAEVFVGSEAERYLRLLQLTGDAPVYPWSVRGLGPRDLDHAAPRDSAGHPWAAAYDYRRPPGARVTAVGPLVGGRYNSAFPYGFNDGVMWAGKGATGVAMGGVALQAGPLTLVLAPVAFVAQNDDFALARNGRPAAFRFQDPRSPQQIDYPQRFGDGAYRRIDPGESTLRIDAGAMAVGVSTAAQQWGPAVEQPMVLGNNAGGYPHLFLGTSRAVNIGIGRLDTRGVWGTIQQSAYSPVTGQFSRRFMAGWVATFAPRFAPNLELGITRFYHTPWPDSGLTLHNFLKPFQPWLKASIDSTGFGADQRGDRDNQLASLFARWVLPRAGFEFYGEYGRDDHSWDVQDFLMEPEHASAYTLGFQKAWRRDAREVLLLRGEVMNARRSNLTRVRTQNLYYINNGTRQGHTLRGQILGAADAYGGAASTLALERYSPSGRWTLRWDRGLRGERAATDSLPGVLDVTHALGVERVLFVRGAELTGGVRGVWELNRDFGDDAFNLNATLAVRARF